jgi:probable rRNA maturation factor
MEPEAEGPVLIFSSRCEGVDRKALRIYARLLSKEAAGGAPFTCLFTGDRRLRQLNSRFLGKDYATDVLSFPAASPGGGLGEMAISVARAREQAAGQGHGLTEEIEILMLHGLLHLLGHDHENDRGAMKRVEARLRRKLGLPQGLIERTER